jgi:hypothetical protein
MIEFSVTCGRSVVFSGFLTNKTDRHDITEILLKMALNIITALKVITIKVDSNGIASNFSIRSCTRQVFMQFKRRKNQLKIRGRDRMVVGFTTTYAISACPSPLTL